MKANKILLLTLLGVSVVCLKTDKVITRSDKVIFEQRNLTHMSTDSEVEAALVDDELLEFQVFFGYDEFTYPELDIEDPTLEEVQAYNLERRAAGKNYHSSRNQQLAKKLDITSQDNLYVSSYGPAADFTMTKDDFLENQDMIYEIASKNEVSCIFVNAEIDRYQPELLAALYETDAYAQHIHNQLDASGVTIGILEPTILNKNHSNFEGCDVKVRDEWYYFETVDTHTTIMGSLIGGKYGVAKNAKLRSVELSGDAISEFDWLLDQNVDIVNMSYGEAEPTGRYSSASAYVDFIAYTYRVIMVAAAGNAGRDSGFVGNPGLAYNCITVGSADSDGRDGFSSYVVIDGSEKPDIMVPGGSVTVPGTNLVATGTSNSAAIASGLIAVMVKRLPFLALNPERLIASIAVSGKIITWNTNYLNCGRDYTTGYGLMSFENTMVFATYSNYREATISTGLMGLSNTILSTASIRGNAGVASLVKSTGSNISNVTKQYYSVFVYNSPILDVPIKKANSIFSNVQVAHWDNTETTYYYMFTRADNVTLPHYYADAYSWFSY